MSKDGDPISEIKSKLNGVITEINSLGELQDQKAYRRRCNEVCRERIIIRALDQLFYSMTEISYELENLIEKTSQCFSFLALKDRMQRSLKTAWHAFPTDIILKVLERREKIEKERN